MIGIFHHLSTAHPAHKTQLPPPRPSPSPRGHHHHAPLTIFSKQNIAIRFYSYYHLYKRSTMGKGGDAAAKSRGMQMADKVQKITWAEVKKHVSQTCSILLNPFSTVSTHIPTMPYNC